MDTWIKQRADAPRGLFAAEAAGLEWLRQAGGAPVVAVLKTTPDSITLERLQTVAPTARAAGDFGAALALTHDAGAPAFGSPPPGFTGPCYVADLPLLTEPVPTWGEFFATQRILPFARLVRDQFGTEGMRVIDALAQRLVDGVFDDGAPPARLHGDLWTGNIVFTPQGVTLIDPSAHGGHRLSDLAMLSLFGAPELRHILRGYELASAHLPDGWRGLIDLHQIYPLLIHAVMFGGAYIEATLINARAYL